MTNKLFSVEDIPRRKFLELGLKGGIALAAVPALLRGAQAGQAPPRPQFALEDLNKVIRRALSKGGDFGEVYIENRISPFSGSARERASGSSRRTRRATRTPTI
jgi:TldD protein